jgi:stage IV sporulation protein FB
LVSLRIHYLFFLELVIAWLAGALLHTVYLFVFVLWHELGHALWAKIKGLTVDSVEILPIGGVARVQGLQQHPEAAAEVALAGPAATAIALLGLLLLKPAAAYTAIVNELIDINLMLLTLNLLPVPPLDGGRLIQSQWLARFGLLKTSKLSYWLGTVFGVLFALVGTALLAIGRPVPDLPVIGVLLFVYARRERQDAFHLWVQVLLEKQQRLWEGQPIPGALIVAHPECQLETVLKDFLPDRYHSVMITDAEGSILATLTEQQLVEAFTHGKGRSTLRELVHS